MTFLKLYLAVYFALLAGAALALWESGALARVPPIWIGLVLVVAIGLGILLAVSSGTRLVANTPDRSE
ncbi:MAG TPA: hypothetical protein VG871_09105 [Vicinamibacterales bacterium]|nr:hypothetical protein [Vicinamibacterales bacterium]